MIQLQTPTFQRFFEALAEEATLKHIMILLKSSDAGNNIGSIQGQAYTLWVKEPKAVSFQELLRTVRRNCRNWRKRKLKNLDLYKEVGTQSDKYMGKY